MKKKKIVAITTAVVLTLGGCSASSANAFPPKEELTKAVAVAKPVLTKKQPLLPLFGLKKQSGFLEKEILRKSKLAFNERKVLNAVKKVKKYAGKTWYVFSGSSPRGWDCSGMVRWTYEQMGIELEHRADAQADSGFKVKSPIPGDIVAFYNRGSHYSFHVGIYIGNGKMIHAYQHGMRTVIQPVKEVIKENWNARVTYTRILPQPAS